MKKYFVISILFFLYACGSQPVPQWKDTAYRQLTDYKANFLADKEDETEPHFVKAKKAISSSNDLNLLAVLYLTKYALHTAALENFDDNDFIRINKLQPNEANQSYSDFLKGNFSFLDKSKLPANYQRLMPMIAHKDLPAAARYIATIDDPLTRLIACGVWVKYLPHDENLLQLAVNTAAAQGWRKPLWAYLGKLQKYYLERQETTKADQIRERLELLHKRY